jgi:murein DD-endopeptidase MepM/ murein hydrolase activator NlpD
LCTLCLSQLASATELYRYQDSSGRWVFGDKKSLSDRQATQQSQHSQQAIEKIFISDRKKKPRPRLIDEHSGHRNQLDARQWRLTNPLPVVVQHWLGIKGEDRFLTSVLARPFEEQLIKPADIKLQDSSAKLEHFYLIGEPIERPDIAIISPPFAKTKRFKVSQGFNGRYSHSGRGNRYALDISMPIGESILAVKPGIVADARDDFSIGGAANYFLDKANHVTIMHDDGSYGIYAHILYGSLNVNIGERVLAGQVLARIGNTGYSTGPHLHFVLRYNSGKGAYSIPFKFNTKDGQRVPKQGQYYSGVLSKIETSK